MKETAKVKSHPFKRGCKCNNCSRQLEEVTIMNRAKMWYHTQMETLKQTVNGFIKIEVKSPEVKPPVKKRTTRKQKE